MGSSITDACIVLPLILGYNFLQTFSHCRRIFGPLANETGQGVYDGVNTLRLMSCHSPKQADEMSACTAETPKFRTMVFS